MEENNYVKDEIKMITNDEYSNSSISDKEFNFSIPEDDVINNYPTFSETDYSESLYDRFNNPNMVYRNFYKKNNYIYKYEAGLNTSSTHAIALGTKEYYTHCSFVNNKDPKSEILVYKLAKKRRVFNIDRQISSLNKSNVIQEVIRYLVQFQQLNYMHKPNYNLSGVYDDVMVRIYHQTKLVPNFVFMRPSILATANKHFLSSIENLDSSIDTLEKLVNVLDLGVTREHYIPSIHGYERRGLLLKVISKEGSKKNKELINHCIDIMMNSKKFVCSDSIKDELKNTGINQIRIEVKQRKEEIDNYNVSTFNAKTYKKYKRLIDN